LRPISPSFDFAREGATARRRLEPTPDRESQSMGLPLCVRRLSISSDFDGSDRRRPSWLGPGIVAGSFRRLRRRALAADHATFIAAPGCVVDAVPGRRPSRADRGAFAAVDPYPIGELPSPGAKPSIIPLPPLPFHPAVTCG